MPYKFKWRGDRGAYYVSYKHIPGKWFSTGCATRDAAVLYAEEQMRSSGVSKAKAMPTLSEFAHNFFGPEDPHGHRRRNEARKLRYEPTHYSANQARLENYILPKFGRHLLDSITDVAIEDWLLELKSYRNPKVDLADASRNKVLMCLRDVLQEAKREGYVDRNVAAEVRMINAEHERRIPYTQQELALLFPRDKEKLLRIWGGAMWTAYFLVLRDTGFRPGEVAGLQRRNYFPELHGVFTEQSVSFRSRKLMGSIKTTKKGQKYKTGVLTDITCSLLDDLAGTMLDTDFFFAIDGRLIIPDVANKHLKGVYKRAGVPSLGRTQYSFRHTFETELAGRVENKVLLELMGHTSFRDEYDHRKPHKILAQLQPVRALLEGTAEEIE